MKKHTKIIGLLATACIALPMIATSQIAVANTKENPTPPLPVIIEKNFSNKLKKSNSSSDIIKVDNIKDLINRPLKETSQTSQQSLQNKQHKTKQQKLQPVKQSQSKNDPIPTPPSPSPQPNPKDDPVAPKAKSPLDFASFKEDPFDTFIGDAAQKRFKNGSSDTYTIGRPLPGGNGAGTIPQGLEAFYKQKLKWDSCESAMEYFEKPVFTGSGAISDDWTDNDTKCTYAIAPLDYQKPKGPTIALALFKIPAMDQAHKLGTLFLNPGGPGVSGVAYAAAFNRNWQTVLDLAIEGTTFAKTLDLNKYFDVVGFDPRGVHYSLPNIQCESRAAFSGQREGSDGLSGQNLDKIQQYNTQECYKNTARGFNGLSGDTVIPQVGTPNVARDLDMLRSAVGDAKLNYLGLSFGSYIGYTYAKLFPHNIRALTIDGIENPIENNPGLLHSPEFAQYRRKVKGDSRGFVQGQTFNETFRQFLKACLAGTITKGVSCPFADPAHPVQGEVTKTQVDAAMKSYQELIQKAWGTGYYHSSFNPQRPVSFADVTRGVMQSMYSKDFWSRLLKGFVQMKETKDAAMLLDLADSYYGYWSYNGEYSGYNLEPIFQTISCIDREYDPASDKVDYSKPDLNQIAYYKLVPYEDPGVNKDGTQRGVQQTYNRCHFYKTHGQRLKGGPIEGLPNTLVVSSTYDPATPFENGPILAKLLKGTLLIVANKQHCAYSHDGLDCATTLTNDYLLHPDDFTAKVKSGFYKTTKDPNFTGKSNVSTKDVYSNIINGTQCQIVSFMEDVSKGNPVESESSQSSGASGQANASSRVNNVPTIKKIGGASNISKLAKTGSSLTGLFVGTLALLMSAVVLLGGVRRYHH